MGWVSLQTTPSLCDGSATNDLIPDADEIVKCLVLGRVEVWVVSVEAVCLHTAFPLKEESLGNIVFAEGNLA